MKGSATQGALTPTPQPPLGARAWYEAARDEGHVRAYVDLAPRETEALTELMKQRYPNSKVEWVRGLDRDLLRRALTEANDGSPGGMTSSGFDVFVGDVGTLLKSAGLAHQWMPPEAGALRPGYFDPDGAWHAVAVTYHVLQYNTEQIPTTARPTRYDQLRAPHFLGRLAVEEESLGWLKGLIESRGRQSVDTLKALGSQAVMVRRGPQTLSHLISAGQRSAAIANRLDAVERDRRGGAKTAWVGIEPVVTQPTAAVVSAYAAHPNGARVLVNFLLSADAQAVLAQLGRIPTRQDVEPEPEGFLGALRTHHTLPPEGAQEQEIRALYADLWR